MNPQLERNLSTLRKFQPGLYPLVQQWVGKNGNKKRDESLAAGLEHETEKLLQNITSQLQNGMDFLYVLSIGDGIVIKRVSGEVTKENRGMLIIEPSPEEFIRVLEHEDLQVEFTNRKIFWVIGQEIEEQVLNVMNGSYCYAAAKPGFFLLAQGRETEFDSLVPFIQGTVKEKKQWFVEAVKQLPVVLKEQEHGDPVKIWCFDDHRNKKKYSLIQHALLRTIFFHLKKKGYSVEYTIMQDGRYYPPYYRIIRLVETKPHLVFLCNLMPSFEFVLGEELCRSLPVPKVTWYADDPVYGEHLLERYKVRDDETQFVADYEWSAVLEQYGATNVQYLPGAVTKTRMGKKRAARKCDIVFVGQVRDGSAFFSRISPSMKTYAERVIAEKLRFPRKRLSEIFSSFPMPTELPLDLFDELKQHLLWEANTRFRVQVISSLVHYDLKIYGNPAWLKYLPKPVAERCFRGVLHYKRLFEVYRNARITLNIHSLQSYTCMNVRDFDVPASGGFLLSDWLPKADEIFVPGFVNDLPLTGESTKEVFFYRSVPELRKMVDYFLANEDERTACVKRAREKVLSEHTYAHRARILDQHFREVLLR